MIRRWDTSAARARRFAPARRGHRGTAASRLRFAWLRRPRGAGHPPRVSLHFRLGVSLTMQTFTLLRRAASTRQELVIRHARATVQHAWTALPKMPAGVRPDVVERVFAAPAARMNTSVRRYATTRLQRDLVSRVMVLRAETEQGLVSRLHHFAVMRHVRTGSASRTAHQPMPTAGRAPGVAGSPRASTLGAAHPGTAPAVIRERWRNTQVVMSRAEPVARPLASVAGHAASRGLSLPVPAFAAQPQPLAAVTQPRAAAPESATIERIEKSLRESLVTVAERTVLRELDRTLRPSAPLGRRLRESIQAEMYDDIVFERERLGDR